MTSKTTLLAARNTHTPASHPERFRNHDGTFVAQVRLGTLTSVLGLLAHDNPDIAATSVGVLHELTDGDVMEGFEQQAAALVGGLLDANALELLVQVHARIRPPPWGGD